MSVQITCNYEPNGIQQLYDILVVDSPLARLHPVKKYLLRTYLHNQKICLILFSYGLCTFTEESFHVRIYCIIFIKFKASQPIYVTQYLFSETESTLHMLGTNEIHEVIHRTSNAEKLETDLITALSHIIGLSRHGGRCYNDHSLRTQTYFRLPDDGSSSKH